MIEITGTHNTCKVYSDTCDKATITQVTNLMDQEFMAGSKVRIMPDCHAGKGCVVGTTMTITDKVVPNLVGVDISCGVLSVKLKEKRIDLPNFDSIVQKYVPAGFNRHDTPVEEFDLSELIADIDRDIASKSIGTLGGGNHFIELDRDQEDNLWLVIHTGSRHLGVEVCEYYQGIAYKKLQGVDDVKTASYYKNLSETLIEKFKAEGRENELEDALAILRKQLKLPDNRVPYALSYLTGEDLQNYLHDMKIAQEYASRNRLSIAKRLMKYAKLHDVDCFDTIHNYIDLDHMILRKGSVSAQVGERCIIPMNMRDGSLICTGKGNPEWNYSAPHGAGRIMSRQESRSTVSMREFKDSMEGIYSSSIRKDTVDEAPMVYKPMEEIVEAIKDTVDIVEIIKPIYNFKAGGKDKN